MSNGGPIEPPNNLDLYLDGQLPAPEARAFAATLAGDPDLAAQVTAQRDIDASLRRLHGAPATLAASALEALAARNPRLAAALASPATPPTTMPLRPRRDWRRSPWVAIAALLLIALGSWGTWQALKPAPDPYAVGDWQAMEQFYRSTSAKGFKPDWVCKDDKEFAEAYRKSLGQPMALAKSPDPAVAMDGLAYVNSISPKTVVLLAHADGKEIMVFADRQCSGFIPTLTPNSNLHVFTRPVGQLVLYELTPLDKPRILDLLSEPH